MQHVAQLIRQRRKELGLAFCRRSKAFILPLAILITAKVDLGAISSVCAFLCSGYKNSPPRPGPLAWGFFALMGSV